jgi:hypothetical protein
MAQTHRSNTIGTNEDVHIISEAVVEYQMKLATR